MSQPVGVAVVGYGYWGPNLARNFSECPGLDLVAVADPREERRALAGRRYPRTRTIQSWEALLEDDSVQALAVATPVALHHSIAKAALAAGRHVWVEKPLAASVAESEELVALAKATGRVLFVDHTFLYSGPVRAVRDLVAAGELGELLYYDGQRINLGLFQSDINVLWDLAPHDLSMLLYWLDRPVRTVRAVGRTHPAGGPFAMAYLTLAFDDDLLAQIHLNWMAPVKVRRTILGGTRKLLIYDEMAASEKILVYDRGVEVHTSHELHEALVDYRMGEMRAPVFDRTEPLNMAAREFAAAIAEGRAPLTDGEAGLQVIRILEAAEQSLAEGGSEVIL